MWAAEHVQTQTFMKLSHADLLYSLERPSLRSGVPWKLLEMLSADKSPQSLLPPVIHVQGALVTVRAVVKLFWITSAFSTYSNTQGHVRLEGSTLKSSADLYHKHLNLYYTNWKQNKLPIL